MKRTTFSVLLLLLLLPRASDARWMNPQTGRFWTMDSYEGNPEDTQSLHKYTYAHADPVNRIDPTGHFSGSVTETFTVSQIQMGLAATLFIVGPFILANSQERQQRALDIEFEHLRKTCPIFDCDGFVKDAASILTRKGKREGTDWKIIIYKNLAGQPVSDFIVPREGFGIYGDGRTAISRNGFHAGIITTFGVSLLRETVSDNNVLFKPRSEWENGYLVGGRLGGHSGPLYELTLRQSADNKLGIIKVIRLADLIGLRY